MTDVVTALDRALEGRVLVVGSLPPAGRDLDLLVRPTDLPTVEAALQAEGFARRGDVWARFHDCGADVVEVTDAEEWELPDAELARLFDESTPLEGCTRVAAPASDHALLILARRLSRGGRLPERHVARAAACDAGTWSRAEAAAAAWGVRPAVTLLRAGTGTTRVASVRRVVGRLPGVRRAARRPVLVAFSGLDGSGKSSQADGARRVLEALGHDAVLHWSRLTFDPGVGRIGDLAKRVLVRQRGAKDGGGGDPGRELRRRSRAVTHAWTTVLALANVIARRRAVLPHLRAGRAVVCDRYVLDAVVQLRLRYGEGRPFPLQEALLRRLSPRPTAAWLLDVPAGVARARKPDDEDLDDAERQAELYRAEHARLGVRRLDGTRAAAELCDVVGRDLWSRVR